MTILLWILGFAAFSGVCAYQRASLPVYSTAVFAYLLVFSAFSTVGGFTLTIFWTVALAVGVLLNVSSLRRRFISKHAFKLYKKVVPNMSDTEKEALEAGDVAFEADLFSGQPDWSKFNNIKPFTLTDEEQAFLDGPVQIFCNMLDDWEITHELHDMTPEQWQYLKDEGFFALIIPKEYGGKGFSAQAHSEILNKVSGLSVTAASTISVPNSLGPAELLLHYGTKEQKNYYLPRLAKGIEIPCFALTGPDAGSDATSLPDYGEICKQEVDGQMVVGIRLNFEKRYITLAPIATILGVAFKLYDPEKILSDTIERGITCALVPRETKGISIGQRHFPLNNPFQNGPITGKNVFIPLSAIIGGETMIGRGWQMLTECLSVGRSISLPSTCAGGCRATTITTGAYSRIRKQFNTSIGNFEGIQEPLGRMGGLAYMCEAARKMTAIFVDDGLKPSVASAIAKYHITEMARQVAIDGMDIHGGKGICLGPNNYIGRGFQGSPISVTVEGANILTRNLIIYGQGAIRCHPYVLEEMHAAKMKDAADGLDKFDKALFGHIGHAISNTVSALWLGLTNARFVDVDAPKEVRRQYQLLTRYSAVLAFTSDMCMLLLGGALKRKELLSARLGDMLSYLYLNVAVLKRYKDEGCNQTDLPIVSYALRHNLSRLQLAVVELTSNLPNRWFGMFIRLVALPLGIRECGPSDKLAREVSKLLMNPCPARERLAKGTAFEHLPHAFPQKKLESALLTVIAAEPAEKKFSQAIKSGSISAWTFEEQLREALDKSLLNQQECTAIRACVAARAEIIAVDDFSHEELSLQEKKPKTENGIQSTNAQNRQFAVSE